MASDTKFWTITGTGDWGPSSNPQVAFGGNVGSTGITGVSSSVISAINAIGAAGVRITELSINVASATGSTIALGTTYTGSFTGTQNDLHYYNIQKPAFGIDGPITYLLPVASSPAGLALTTEAGLITTFAAGSLKQGTLYPIQVGTISTVTGGDFVGMSEY